MDKLSRTVELRARAQWRFDLWVKEQGLGDAFAEGDWSIPRLREIKCAPLTKWVSVTVVPRRDLTPKKFVLLLRKAAEFVDSSYCDGAGGAIWLNVEREVEIDTPTHLIIFDDSGITVTNGEVYEIGKVCSATSYRLPRDWLGRLTEILHLSSR